MCKTVQAYKQKQYLHNSEHINTLLIQKQTPLQLIANIADTFQSN